MIYKPDQSKYRELLPGVEMKVLSYGMNSMLCEFKLKQGAYIPVHQHSQEQTGYLVHGSVRFFGDEGETTVEPGCSWSFKGGIAHGAEAMHDSVLIEVFSPVRQDYLSKD